MRGDEGIAVLPDGFPAPPRIGLHCAVSSRLMNVTVLNAQREAPVDRARMARLACRAARRLRIQTRGTLGITFLDRRAIRSLNRRFLRHDRETDVLSFRYVNSAGGWGLGAGGKNHKTLGPEPRAQSPEPIVGEIFIAPALARIYAKTHGLRYEEELSRYVVHGLLHWMGYTDKTAVERQAMRRREDRMLSACGVWPQSPRAPSPELRARRNGHSHD